MPESPKLPFFSLLLALLSFSLLLKAAAAAAGFLLLEAPFSDKTALLHLKSFVTEDPLGLLSNWNPDDDDFCSWNGVKCDHLSKRVTSLTLSPDGTCLLLSSGNPNPNIPLCFGFRSPSRSGWSLKGRLSPSVGDLTQLRVLSLGFNSFSGELPLEIGKLRSLQVLDLGFNSFHGKIPPSFAGCIELRAVNLAGNQLNGSVPPFLAKFQNLRFLSLSFNRFDGRIPDEFGENCGVLEHFHLAGNNLSGSIPSNLGNCSRLRSLMLFANQLASSIPSDLGKLQRLEAIDLSRNFLAGAIPSELGDCKQLELLVLKNNFDLLLSRNASNSGNYVDDFNYFEGGMPRKVVNLPNLRILWAPSVNLEGDFPQEWGSCGSLQIVNLAQNYFTGGIPASFRQCNSLQYLDLSSNQLSGWLPAELPIPCMVVFNVSRNLLSGDIPRFFLNNCHQMGMNFSEENMGLPDFYFSLFYSAARSSISFFSLSSSNNFVILHDVSENQLTGPIPAMPISSKLLATRPVYAFMLNDNKLEGSLSAYPFDPCANLDTLIIDISGNRISGELPLEMGNNCSCLKYLDMAENEFVGSIPLSFSNFSSLVYLDLSRNKLQGQIPSYFGLMKDMRHLSLFGNNFTGKIPPDLSQLALLEVLELSSNSLSGEIPAGLAKLGHLTVLQLDKNDLTGQIPAGFSNYSLVVFNVSFNNLSGSIPPDLSWMKCESMQGNRYLQPCAPPSLSPSSDQNSRIPQPEAFSPARSAPYKGNGFTPIEIASVLSASIIVVVLIALVFILLCMRKCALKPDVQGLGKKEVLTFHNIGFQLTYDNVVKATGNFNVQNCIGNGGFGATYKAEITLGVVVAVKRLSIGRFQGVQQFHAEIRILGRVQHPNLVTLIGYHASEAEMFLIYNYLPGGNLERFIQDRSKRNVDWSMLHKIALDIARALAYLHDECVPRVLHRDIKPSNILLDNNFNAYLSDFGLARLLGTSETHATTDVAGTFGYVAPEYAMTCRVSDKADVYSYGVVLLELISDKKALDPSFSSYGNGFNIAAWANMLLREGRAREFFTAGLWDSGPQDDLIDTLHLAVTCTVDSLSTRPSMKQVAQRLKRIQPPTC